MLGLDVACGTVAATTLTGEAQVWQPGCDWARAGAEALWRACLSRGAPEAAAASRAAEARSRGSLGAASAGAQADELPLWVKPPVGSRFDAAAVVPPPVGAGAGASPSVWLSQVPNTMRAILAAHRAPALPRSLLPWTRAEGAAMAASLAACNRHMDRRRALTSDDPTITGRMSLAALASLADRIALGPAGRGGGPRAAPVGG